MNRSVKLLSYRTLRLVCICIAIVIASACLAVFSVSLSIKAKTASSILSAESIGAILDVDCIIVLGAGLRSDGSPSDMLADRLSVGISLLEKHPDAVLLLTGDNSGDQYNEVAAMKTYALEHGVDEAKIIEDDFGFSTYESIYRAKNTFNVDKAVIVSQEYHLYRALYIADQMGIDAVGVGADLRGYSGQSLRNAREHAARVKDFFFTLLEYTPAEK